MCVGRREDGACTSMALGTGMGMDTHVAGGSGGALAVVLLGNCAWTFPGTAGPGKCTQYWCVCRDRHGQPELLEMVLGRFLAPLLPKVHPILVPMSGPPGAARAAGNGAWTFSGTAAPQKCTQYWYLCCDRHGQLGLLEIVLGRFLASPAPESAPNIGTYVVTATGCWGGLGA